MFWPIPIRQAFRNPSQTPSSNPTSSKNMSPFAYSLASSSSSELGRQDDSVFRLARGYFCSAHRGSRLAQATQLAALNCRGPEGRRCLLRQPDLFLDCCHYSRCWGVSTMSILLGCVVLSQLGLQSFSVYVFFLQVHPALAGHLNLVGPRGQVSLGTACCVVVYTDLWDLKDILPSLKMGRNVP